MKPVRSSERPERHFADSMATVRKQVVEEVSPWLDEYLKEQGARRRPGGGSTIQEIALNTG